MNTEQPTSVCRCTPVLETQFGGERERPPSLAIVEAVAAAEGVIPPDLDPVYDEVDPDAVDRLFTGRQNVSRPPKLLQLSVLGWNVFVRDDGAIRVCDPDRLTEPAPAFEKPISD